MDLELCTEQISAIEPAANLGFRRIELCSGLSLGGLTPSRGLIDRCVALGKPEIHVMIRPREGGFRYTPDEWQIMIADIRMAADSGACGVVFGCLNESLMPDLPVCKQLLETARSRQLECTFHRAFDLCTEPIEALEAIIGMGFDRLLTSGQQPGAEEGISQIRLLVEKANGRIQLMAGAGILPSNAWQIAETGVDALHFTARKITGPATWPGMGNTYTADVEKMEAIARLFL